MELDHLILPVTDTAASLRFYHIFLGLRHEGQYGPFDILRVHPGLTIDLLPVASVPQPGHLAFRLSRAEFDRAVSELRDKRIAFGTAPHDRSGGAPSLHAGARGMAPALYFSDPDGHNIEIRAESDA